MKKLTLTNYKKIFITGLLFSICVSAQAFMVDFDVSGTNATGIRNLDIGGTFYDVTVVESLASTVAPCPGDGGTYPCDLYAANPASGVGNVAGATVAAAQIALALNEDVSIGGSGNPVALSVGPAGLDQLEVLVPWQFDVSACNGDVGGTTGTCAQQAVALSGAGSWGALGIVTQKSRVRLTLIMRDSLRPPRSFQSRSGCSDPLSGCSAGSGNAPEKWPPPRKRPGCQIGSE